MKEKTKLVLIVGIIICLSAIISAFVYSIWFVKSDKNSAFIGLIIAPDSTQAKLVQATKNGVELLIDEVNKSRSSDNRTVNLKIFYQNANLIDSINQFRKEHHLTGLLVDNTLAHFDFKPDNDLAELPRINLSSTDRQPIENNSSLYSLVFDQSNQARFIANYARNVLGLMIITIIHDNNDFGLKMAEDFSAVYNRFGTKIHYTHRFDSRYSEDSINQLIQAIKDKQDLGTIYFIGSAKDTALFIAKARDAGIKNKVVATDIAGTHAFTKALAQFAKNPSDLEHYTDGIIFPAPLLFDTAGAQEQQFKNNYLQHYKSLPDWSAAYAYDATKLLVYGLRQTTSQKINDSKIVNESINKFLLSLDSPDSALLGATGATWFNKNKENEKNIQIGIYDGLNIIAAPTQLQPIKLHSSVNYIEELKSGKMLYVNDRFMYKTNVIYTGIELHDITNIDFEKNTAELDVSIWFRYRGNFNPADINFVNAVSEITLTDPVHTYEKDAITLNHYRFKEEFKLDFLTSTYSYGTHSLGFSFRHKDLNRNNVIYVVDELGMDANDNRSLKEKLESRRILSSTLGWKINQAQFSQSLYTAPTFGDPTYVGYGAISPDFSRIDYEIMLTEDRFNLHDFIASQYFIYIGILGIVGSIGAAFIDKKYSGYFWLTSSWVMRMLFWPLTLLSISNLAIDMAIRKNITNYYIEIITLSFDSLWWIIYSILVVMALNRFLWKPLEQKSQRKIPGVIKNFTSGIVYLLFFFGIIAFVFHEPLSSLLATSGLFAMIMGLAVQGNVANIFSGIVINLEKPFTVGDIININDHDTVEIVDMTWRSLHVKDLQNSTISIPNSVVAEAEVINYSASFSQIEITLNCSPKYSPDIILSLIKTALGKVNGIHDIKPPEQLFNGIHGEEVPYAEYVIYFCILDYKKHIQFRDKIWKSLHHEFTNAEISFDIA